MTRSVPTKCEIASGNALVAYLRETGHTVQDVHFRDRPDLRLLVDGAVIGCECAQIPPARILRWQHTHFKRLVQNAAGATAVHVVWPKEAHVWVSEAILDKNRKYGEYQSNLGTQVVDLLIHTPDDSDDDVVGAQNAAVMNQIRWAVSQSLPKFRYVYFWSARVGIERMHPAEMPASKPVFDFSRGYPTEGFLLGGSGAFTTTRPGEPPNLYDYGVVEPQVLIVPPMSQEFKSHAPHYVPRQVHLKVFAYDNRAELSMEYV